MGKYVFTFIIFFLLFSDPFAQTASFENNLIQLLLYAGFNISAVEGCRNQTNCLRSIFDESNDINYTLLFEFENLNISDGQDPRFLLINQLRDFVPGIMNLGPNNPVNINRNNNEATSNSSTEPQRTIDLSQCGVYPACVVNAVPGVLGWSYTCDQPIVVFIAVIGIILSAVVIISNILIILVTLRSKSLRKPHGYFKISLAMADLLAGIFVIPSIVHNSLTTIDYDRQLYSTQEVIVFTSVDETPSAEADFFGVVGVVSTITAVFSLLALSIDSFLAVKWPMQYRIGDIVTSKKALLVVALIWIASLLLGFLPLLAKDAVRYGLSYYTFQYLPVILPLDGTTSEDSTIQRYPHAFAYFIIVWGIPFVVTWVLTVLTSMQSRKMLKNMKEARRRSVRSEKALNKVDRDLVRTVAVVLSLFTITILPVFGVGIASAVAPSGQCSSSALVLAFFFSTYIFICGRFLNVIIYNVFNKEFRTAFISFSSSITSICCPGVLYSGLPKKRSETRSGKPRGYSTDKSHSKETEVTTSRGPSGSISLSTTTERSTLPSPSAPATYKYSVSGESDVQGPMYSNSVFTIDEAEEK